MKEEDFFDSEIAFINSERPDTEKQKNFKKKNDQLFKMKVNSNMLLENYRQIPKTYIPQSIKVIGWTGLAEYRKQVPFLVRISQWKEHLLDFQEFQDYFIKNKQIILPKSLRNSQLSKNYEFQNQINQMDDNVMWQIFHIHLQSGHSNSRALELQTNYGKNEFFKVKSKYFQDFYNFTCKLNNLINKTAAQASCTQYNNEIDFDMVSMNPNQIENENKSFVIDQRFIQKIEYEYPVAQVLRNGKNYLIPSSEIVIGDIIILNHTINKVCPCDLVLFESLIDLKVGSYLELFPDEIRNLFEFKNLGVELPQGVYRKRGGFGILRNYIDVIEECNQLNGFILNSPNYIPMGVRIIQGEGKGICVRVGNKSTLGCLKAYF